MGITYYLIEVSGGVEPSVRGPFQTEDERDNVAKQVHETQEDDDSLFWADVDETGMLSIGSYLAGFFLQESTESID